MKVILYLILITSVCAQDSTFVKLSLHQKDYPSAIREVKSLPATITEMKLNRIWNRNNVLYHSPKVNKSALIEFKEKKKNFIDSDMFLVVVGSAIIFGATAAYFKLESDSAYDKFLTTNNKSYKDKTDRYDLYSGLALGALEINFGILIYKFLTD